MVNVLFFGRLKEQLGKARVITQLQTPSTVAELHQQLLLEHPHWQDTLLLDALKVAVDQQIADVSTLVPEQAEVAFFPPVTGG